MTENIIDSVSGQLRFKNDFCISSLTTPEDLLQHFGQENVSINDVKTGWKHYSVRNIKINDTYFIITLYFDNNVLKMLDFIVSDKFIVAGFWDDWNEQKELQKHDYYDHWLTKEIGSNRQFAWGTINSFYDNKGGFSSIVLKYK